MLYRSKKYPMKSMLDLTHGNFTQLDWPEVICHRCGESSYRVRFNITVKKELYGKRPKGKFIPPSPQTHDLREMDFGHDNYSRRMTKKGKLKRAKNDITSHGGSSSSRQRLKPKKPKKPNEGL